MAKQIFIHADFFSATICSDFISLDFLASAIFLTTLLADKFVPLDKLFADKSSSRLFFQRLFFTADFCQSTVFATFDLKTARNTGLLQVGGTVG